MSEAIVIIGASGAIGQALVSCCLEQFPGTTMFALSRSGFCHPEWQQSVQCRALDTANDSDIAGFVGYLHEHQYTVKLAVCTVGVLHQDATQDTALAVYPEKRLEDLQAQQLSHYFAINSIIPALWLKHLVGRMAPSGATVVCLSARVGSIQDNRLGGWYGYRASKAALNMLVKTAAVEYQRRSKHTRLVCYHPGTVDSDLSAPFQANVAAGKLFTAEFTARQLLRVLGSLSPDASPSFLDWQGKSIDW